MPQGCATWPAAWETLESDWPASGEVDVVEGVNDGAPNQSTLHTSGGCTIPGSGAMSGCVSGFACGGFARADGGFVLRVCAVLQDGGERGLRRGVRDHEHGHGE